jgi:hypothetical protein
LRSGGQLYPDSDEAGRIGAKLPGGGALWLSRDVRKAAWTPSTAIFCTAEGACHFLRKLDEEIEWSRLVKRLLGYYRGKEKTGQAPYSPALILKMLLLSYLYNISERQVEMLASVIKAPAEPAHAPAGDTYTTTGTGLPRKSSMISCVVDTRPPGVLSWTITAVASSFWACFSPRCM